MKKHNPNSSHDKRPIARDSKSEDRLGPSNGLAKWLIYEVYRSKQNVVVVILLLHHLLVVVVVSALGLLFSLSQYLVLFVVG